ncbi:MAG: potassium channel protein [Actinobacteria bacterium]|nr:potassium channel protein [Actinomycetota bacterium]
MLSRSRAQAALQSGGRVGLGLTILAGIVAAGVSWFAIVEDFTILEALYQTVLTISTVGFREVHPIEGRSQLFTIFVILFGVGAMLYTVTALFEVVVENQLGRIGRRRMERRISDLSGHAVVCGYGRVGRIVARLLDTPVGVVVVDSNPERARAAAEAGFAVVEGDATDDDALERAGLDRARILVSALPTDADNVYVVLSGRAANAGLHIVARARAEASEPKLARAGADRVINPQEIGARRIAAFALQPAVSDFLDVVMHGAGAVEYRLEELMLPQTAPVAGMSIREAHIRDQTGALLLALRGTDARFLTNPEPETRLEPGMTVIAIGTNDQLDRLHRVVHDAGD